MLDGHSCSLGSGSNVEPDGHDGSLNFGHRRSDRNGHNQWVTQVNFQWVTQVTFAEYRR